MPTYNTIMTVAVGAALLSLASFGKNLVQRKPIHPEGYALNFGILGFILTLTGGHMTLTWPLAAYFPFDNIIFGEPSLGFGVLLLAAAFFLWRRAELFRNSSNLGQDIAEIGRPLRFLLYGLGLALIAIACAGVAFQLFAAPPEEPISGRLRTILGSKRSFCPDFLRWLVLLRSLFRLPWASCGSQIVRPQ